MSETRACNLEAVHTIDESIVWGVENLRLTTSKLSLGNSVQNFCVMAFWQISGLIHKYFIALSQILFSFISLWKIQKDHFCTWHFGKRHFAFADASECVLFGHFVSMFVSPKGQFGVVDIPEWGHSISGKFWHGDISKPLMCPQGKILACFDIYWHHEHSGTGILRQWCWNGDILTRKLFSTVP